MRHCDRRSDTIGNVLHPRDLELSGEAIASLAQILAIMTDQVMGGEGRPRWEIERLMELEARLGVTMGVDDVMSVASAAAADARTVTLGIDDAALLLDGMAFTEIASAEFAWFEMVQWTADFITAELRQHWTDEEWLAFSAR